MRVLLLAAGAGGMYCGSCMHDNRLAAALRARGRDVTLFPLYTPLKTDEPDVSARRIHYGGINAYLQQRSVLFQMAPRWLDRLFDARWLLRLAGRMASSTRAQELGPMTLSVLRGEHGAQRKELDRLIESVALLRPELVQLPNLLFLGAARRLRAALGVPVVCELTGEDVFVDQLPDPFRDEVCEEIRRRAGDAEGYLALTRYYADHAARRFGLPRERITYVPMGIRAKEFAAPSESPTDEPAERGAPLTIGYLARVCPEKGVDELCEAYLEFRRLRQNCRLKIAGYLGAADRAFFAAALAKLRAAGCTAEAAEYVGEVSLADKAAFLRSLDIFCAPTRYPEAKGFYVLEALAAGVPVVLPRHGSFPEIAETTGGALLYQPGDRVELVQALIALSDEPERRRALAAAGQAAVRAAHEAEFTADAAWSFYKRLVEASRSGTAGRRRSE